MTEPVFSPARYLATLLHARLTVTHVRTDTFSPGRLTLDEVVTTHRLILVRRGRLSYKVDGATAEISPGQQIFVPAWSRRAWQSKNRQPVEFAWFEFTTDEADESLHTLFFRHCPNLGLESASLRRMLRFWPRNLPAANWDASTCPLDLMDQLQLEGEAKAMLSRFWPQAQPLNPDGVVTFSPTEEVHPDLKSALGWMQENFLRPEALHALYEEIHLSPNHFRLLFRRVMGCSPQDYLQRLRLRRARHLVCDSDLPLKQIAAQVGFTDPLFFSRQYHRFWGLSPRRDRSQKT